MPPQCWPEVTYCPMAGLPSITIPAQSVCMGLEATPEAFVGHLVLVFREVRRVLRDDGTLWLNIGDSMAGSGGAHASHHSNPGISQSAKRQQTYGKHTYHDVRPLQDGLPAGLKAKDLCMIPSRLALALQADGWWLRSDIIWEKPNPMPESVTDRPTKSHEYIFLLTKSAHYYFDADAVREQRADDRNGSSGDLRHTYSEQSGRNGDSGLGVAPPYAGRNMRSVWRIATRGYAGAHFATFASEIPRRAIKAGTSERGCCPKCQAPWVRVVEREGETPRMKMQAAGMSAKAQGKGQPVQGLDYAGGHDDNLRNAITIGWAPGCTCDAGDPVPCVVLDPFLGSGTTVMVAKELGRKGIGCDLSAEYLALAVKSVIAAQPPLPLLTAD